jgi:proteasome assembly chaperone (PAC2) family protein
MKGKELHHNGTFVKELGPEITLEDAILIQGLPGMGFVGHLAAKFLIDEFSAVEFARIYSSYFPSIVVLKSGEGKLVRIELFAVSDIEPNLIIMTGDVQPSETGMIQVLDFILDYCANKGVKKVIAVGGLRAENGPEVAGFAFSKEDLEFLKEYDVGTLENGQVTGK